MVRSRLCRISRRRAGGWHLSRRHGEPACRRWRLIVFYSRDLEASEALVLSHGASIIKPVFDFPGGRRFQFAEPTGNEFAFWSNV